VLQARRHRAERLAQAAHLRARLLRPAGIVLDDADRRVDG
jgi:hypothetical protein